MIDRMDMSEAIEITTQTLEEYEGYLLILARSRIGPQFQARISPSDIVQQTLLEALCHRNQFRGTTIAEVSAWLRSILSNQLNDAFRTETRQKRDIHRERSLQETIDDSHLQLEQCLVALESSPSVKAERGEQLVRLAQALAELPDDQREAVTLKFLHGFSVEEAAEKMVRTRAAVAGLLRRGLLRLRTRLSEPNGYEL